MGSFGGHALPGTLFFIFGLWQTLSSLHIFYKRLRQGKAYYGNVAFPLTCACCCRHRAIPWEGIVKVVGCVVGMCVEGVGFLWHEPAMIQHFTMYAFFLMAGIVDLLQHHRAPLPANLDYLIHTLAFLVEGLLFKFHLHGRDDLDIMLHTLLVYACFACAAAFLVELVYRQTVLAPLCRGYFIMLQGTWFWQVGFILYNPVGERWTNSHGNMMISTIVAGWHMFAIFALQMVICISMAWLHGASRAPEYNESQTAPMPGFVALRERKDEENGLLLKDNSDDDDAL